MDVNDMKPTVSGLKIQPLSLENTPLGRRLEIFEQSQKISVNDVSLQVCYPNSVYAWFANHADIQWLACVNGDIQLAIFDQRRSSESFGAIDERFVSEHNLQRIGIPQNVCFGWKTLSNTESRILMIGKNNKSVEKAFPFDTELIPYRW